MSTTKVLFRKYEDGDILAIFPEEHYNYDLVMSYQHTGQHGEANPKYCLLITEEASPEESESLKTELESIEYELEAVEGLSDSEIIEMFNWNY